MELSRSKGGQNMRNLFFFFWSYSLKIGSFLDSHRLIDVRFMGVFVDIIRQFSMYKKRCFPTFLHKQYVHMSDRLGEFQRRPRLLPPDDVQTPVVEDETEEQS